MANRTLTAFDRVKIARDPKRPHVSDFIANICSDFEELHGDRLVNDDRGLVAGFGTIDSFKCLVLGHHKGATIEENMEANFGMAQPDGYRKAMRLAALAEKFHLPVVTFVDTPGAYPGDTAEARGQAEAIAKSLEFFSLLKTPVVVVITGEGGSGGALAIAVGDRILMMENAVYSVISPEGCASILWKDASKAPEAAECLKISAEEIKALGLIEQIVPETNKSSEEVYDWIEEQLVRHFDAVEEFTVEELTERRYQRFRKIGATEG